MKKNIALVTGGFSKEAEISYKSVITVYNNTDKEKYNVYIIDINSEGWWHIKDNGEKILVDKNNFTITDNHQTIHFDAVLMCIHGTPGEDGKLQGYFDMLQIPYTSCDAATSALTFNKRFTVAVASFGSIHVSKSVMLLKNNFNDNDASKIIDTLTFPVFVKPNNGGSSIGMSKVNKTEHLIPAINKARNNKNPAIKKLLDDWMYHKNMLTKLYTQPIAERVYNTDSLEYIVNTIEKQINQQTTNKITLSDAVYTWQDIQQKLQPNEVAIEYIKYPFYRNNIYSDSILYAAIIITKNAHPKFIHLGTENKIETLMKGNATNSKEVNIHRLYRSRLVKKENTFPGEELCKIIWQPLKPYIQNSTIISFAPDGLLHKIAFNALPLSDDKILIDSFQMQQYSSIIQIADRKEKLTNQWQSAFLIGNVDYNNATQKNGTNISYTNTKNISWAELPGTNKELDDIKKLFSTNKIQTTSFSKANATEEAFKKLSYHSTNIIHIATHGFFLNQIMQKTQSDISISGEQVISTSENPLLRSGIILAGANKAWSGEKLPENTEDGIVNAYEISQLDLSSTNLVVLSACETALGDIKGTEGVFGLQRAFKMAGVKNLIVSLWQVPDKETAELMHSFYTKLLQGNNIRTAFYAAQKEMREKYAPYSWAAFILIE
jgi:CHAT domain-containing protein